MTLLPFSDLDDARRQHAALLEIIIHHPGGWADKATLRKVMASCVAATGAIEDAQCKQHLGAIAAYAAALFSEREHRKWGHGQTSGADFLRLKILNALHLFNLRLSAIEETRRGPGERVDENRKGPSR